MLKGLGKVCACEARDLVLLDVREGDELEPWAVTAQSSRLQIDRARFDQCHLPLAVSYPAPKINRDSRENPGPIS